MPFSKRPTPVRTASSPAIKFAENVFKKDSVNGNGSDEPKADLNSSNGSPQVAPVLLSETPRAHLRRQSSFASSSLGGQIASVFRFGRLGSDSGALDGNANVFEDGGSWSAASPSSRKMSLGGSNSAATPSSRKMSLGDSLGFNLLRQRSRSFVAFNRLQVPKSSKKVRKPYHSTRLGKEIEKPWMKYKDPAQRWAKIIFWSIASMGLIAGVALIYLGVRNIPHTGNLCLVMDDDFSGGINPDFWTHEVRIDGYGNHHFDWTTADPRNSYVDNSTLYIVPTLTEDVIGADAIMNGYTLNLTRDGTCTAPNTTDCAVISNSTTETIINPVQSARMITRGKVSIKYGKVEVVAKMPKGDWIWPAIWMMPQDSVYGEWPRSGEIDIVESRGNNRSYGDMGSNHVQTTLHWGPDQSLDSYWRTFGIASQKRQGYEAGFHKYTLEWTDKYLWSYIDNRINTVYKLDFDKSFWSKGDYPERFDNNSVPTVLTNPWYLSNANSAPFDESFYLILNVAVGGTNGYFPNNLGGKPWLDSSLTPMKDFWEAKERWYPTWPQDPKERGMAVSSVKLWQKC